MKTMVVYDSQYGNTAQIAQAIVGALKSAVTGPVEVDLRRIDDVEPDQLASLDLLVIGSPTHGALPAEGVQRLLAQIGPPDRAGARAATFDTRLAWSFLDRWGGFAAPKMADALTQKGWILAAAPEGFIVKGLRKGPLRRGEVDRAAVWAKSLFKRESAAVLTRATSIG